MALISPAAALGHVANVEYRFPLPIWLYAFAGGFAVLASAPAAAIAVRRPAAGFLEPLMRWGTRLYRDEKLERLLAQATALRDRDERLRA